MPFTKETPSAEVERVMGPHQRAVRMSRLAILQGYEWSHRYGMAWV